MAPVRSLARELQSVGLDPPSGGWGLRVQTRPRGRYMLGHTLQEAECVLEPTHWGGRMCVLGRAPLWEQECGLGPAQRGRYMFRHPLQRVGCVVWTHPCGGRFYGHEPPSVASDPSSGGGDWELGSAYSGVGSEGSDPPFGGGDWKLGSAHRGMVCRLVH